MNKLEHSYLFACLKHTERTNTLVMRSNNNAKLQKKRQCRKIYSKLNDMA